MRLFCVTIVGISLLSQIQHASRIALFTSIFTQSLMTCLFSGRTNLPLLLRMLGKNECMTGSSVAYPPGFSGFKY